MLDEMLAGLFGEAVLGRIPAGRRARRVARLFFGLVGTALGVAGAAHFATRDLAPHDYLRGPFVILFAAVAAFALFVVALGRAWRWPGWLVLASLVAVFVARIGFGP